VSHDDSSEPRVPQTFWDTLRNDAPDPRAIERAYLRFTTPVRPTITRFVLARWLVAGFALGCGVVYAATAEPHFGALWASTPNVVPNGSATSAPGLRQSKQRAAPPVSSALAPPTAEAPTPEPLPSSSVHLASSASGSSTEGSGPDPTWQRAAMALRSHDYAPAEAALSSLEVRGAPADREAASLALAQVYLARGQSAEARVRLEQLSKSARSELTREKARTLLANSVLSSQRSFEVAPATQ
jgi:hypothetical protein